MAEGVGFEPTEPLTVRSISSRVPSTKLSHPSIRESQAILCAAFRRRQGKMGGQSLGFIAAGHGASGLYGRALIISRLLGAALKAIENPEMKQDRSDEICRYDNDESHADEFLKSPRGIPVWNHAGERGRPMEFSPRHACLSSSASSMPPWAEYG
jgi:hypothetical protein